MGARSLLPEVSIIAENGTFNFLGRLPYTASTSVLCKSVAGKITIRT